jgi:hypothetical protein
MAANATSGQAEINVGNGERIGSFVAGAVLIGRALSRPTAGRIAAAIGGAVLLARAITGHCGVYEKFGIGGSAEQQRRGGAIVRGGGMRCWRPPRKVFRRAIRRPGRPSSARSRDGRSRVLP